MIVSIIYVVILLPVVICYCKWNYQYWKRKGIPYLRPHLLYGNIARSVKGKEHLGLTISRMYEEMKRKNWKHGGVYFFLSPNYLVTDLDYVKNILTKDFHHFVDRPLYYNEKSQPLSAHLINLGGAKWTKLRTKLTPAFTSAKMKMMFQTLIDCEINLHKNVEAKCERNEPIDIKEISSCFAIDVIGSSAFGLECKTFEQENSDFRVYGRKLFAKTTWGKLINIFSTNFPKLANALNIKTIPNDVSDFFMTVVENIISYREQNEFIRNDFMQSLIKMKNSRDPEKRLTGEEVAAQCAVFFVANFETSSTLMTFALFELAKNQYIQEKVRNEINKLLNKYNGSITYDFIDELKYMNQVLDEILRKYPPVPFIRRRCVKDYKIPDEDIVIEKGTIVVIPILGIHHDKEYYPDPDKFDPERFSEENKSCRHHYAHLPFGEGPRICIGKRFGLMQSKVGLTSLLKNYRFTLNKETKEPLTVDLNSMVLETEEKIWLDIQKI